MTEWHRTRRGDLALRALGSGGCALSYFSLHHLMAMHAVDPAHWRPGLFAYVLTATGFLGASAGAGLVASGAHLFDKVEVSERWRTSRLLSERTDAIDLGSFDLPIPDPQGPAGSWESRPCMREGAAVHLGRQNAFNADTRNVWRKIEGEEAGRNLPKVAPRA